MEQMEQNMFATLWTKMLIRVKKLQLTDLLLRRLSAHRTQYFVSNTLIFYSKDKNQTEKGTNPRQADFNIVLDAKGNLHLYINHCTCNENSHFKDTSPIPFQ